jgi:hypothetical protein
LAYNTGTTDLRNSCSAYKCPPNFVFKNGTCVEIYNPDKEETIYGLPNDTQIDTIDQIVDVTDVGNGIKNYCPNGSTQKDSDGNCCVGGYIYSSDNKKEKGNKNICIPENTIAIYVTELDCDEKASAELFGYYCNNKKGMSSKLYCIVGSNEDITTMNIDSGTLYCPGFFVLINNYGDYYAPYPVYTAIHKGQSSSTGNTKYPYMYYLNQAGEAGQCTYKYSEGEKKWKYVKNNGTECTDNVDNSSSDLNITYGN